ncbi:hypothetical protein [Vibrio rotiferianus]|uniref:hypothetical protein n=1 Tax=Vibrio rotiferianus TaxID=190895 RepID=UPI000B599EAF|nr:hypothetical protein [Vibrio rotiferianus]ASI96244.1 hypothetical protein BSZ04_14815 [Vibrio rotiferianus]
MARYRKNGNYRYRARHSSKPSIETGIYFDIRQVYPEETEALEILREKIRKGYSLPAFIENIIFKFMVGAVLISAFVSFSSDSWDSFFVRYAFVLSLAVSFAIVWVWENLFKWFNPSLFKQKEALELFVEDKKKLLLLERNSRPSGFQSLTLNEFKGLKSALHAPLSPKTKGSSCVYHIAVNGWDLTKGYVGVSNNFFKRKQQHFSSLKVGEHENKKLQDAFNLYGSELKMKILHNGISESESYFIEKKYRPNANMALNIRRGGK